MAPVSPLLNLRDDQQVVAVVVTYFPDKLVLQSLLLALVPQVKSCLIVNNATELPISDSDLGSMGVEVLHLGGNEGVARALNVGVAWARTQHASYVLTMDQDSIPNSDMVARLTDAHAALGARGYKTAAVGPVSVDRRDGRKAPFVLAREGARICYTPHGTERISVDHLITSGCLISMNALDVGGGFSEDLFIDYVDIEWCLRLRAGGWFLYGVGDAVLAHTLGDRSVHFLGRSLPWHGPQRHYYLFRNAMLLQKLHFIPTRWKLLDAWLLCKRFVFIAWTAPRGGGHVRAALTGIWDGLSGRKGPARRQF